MNSAAKVYCCPAVVVVLLIANSATAADNNGETIKPPDVFVRVGVVLAELESLRFEMGKPKNAQPPLNVSGAQPREVYFQAQTLFRKAERLCFEHVRRHKAEPPRPKRQLRPGDVYVMVNAALDRLQEVKQKLGLNKDAKPARREKSKTPNDVFRAIVDANRQLNLLLDKRFTPADVYQQVTRAIANAQRLLEEFPDATTMPVAPKFERGKRPSDVYRRLVGCYDKVRQIAAASGERMLEFKPDKKQIENAEPSDVYDVASLIVSELVYLHSKLPKAKAPWKAYYPGRKFPSHVYQRAGILDRQLGELKTHAAGKPQWLKGRK